MVGGIATLLGVAIAGAAGAQSPAARYHVTQRIPLGRDGGWDYIAVDTARARTGRRRPPMIPGSFTLVVLEP